MSYSIEWEGDSWDELNALSQDISLRIYEKIEDVKQNPEHFLERLKSMPEFKIRIGDYRVILLWIKNEQKLKIQAVGHRKSIYKRYKTE